MLPVNGKRSVCVEWHWGHGGVVSADSGIAGTQGIYEGDVASVPFWIAATYWELPLAAVNDRQR
jgi:hypothetical protein